MLAKLTIDKLGRIVLPKPVREQLQLSAGDELELESLDDRITLRPLRGTAQLRKNAVSGSSIPGSRFRPLPYRRLSSKCAANATIPERCGRVAEEALACVGDVVGSGNMRGFSGAQWVEASSGLRAYDSLAPGIWITNVR